MDAHKLKYLFYLGSASEIVAFRLRGCDQIPCTFNRGGEYYGELDVIAGRIKFFLIIKLAFPLINLLNIFSQLAAPTHTLPFVIQAILGFPLPPVTIFQGDACEDLVDGYCPTTVGERITARLYMDIPTTLPGVLQIFSIMQFSFLNQFSYYLQISTNVRATVRDHLNQVHVCVQIPVTLA